MPTDFRLVENDYQQLNFNSQTQFRALTQPIRRWLASALRLRGLGEVWTVFQPT